MRKKALPVLVLGVAALGIVILSFLPNPLGSVDFEPRVSASRRQKRPEPLQPVRHVSLAAPTTMSVSSSPSEDACQSTALVGRFGSRERRKLTRVFAS